MNILHMLTKRLRFTDCAVEPVCCLVGLFNCRLSKVQVTKGHQSTRFVSVGNALGLCEAEWPDFIRQARFLDCRELAVPLSAGYTVECRNADILVIQLVLCTFEDKQLSVNVIPCGSAKSGQMKFLHRCFVGLLAFRVSTNILNIWPSNHTLCVDDLAANHDLGKDVFRNLAAIATSQLESVSLHQQYYDRPRKFYDREISRSNELLKNLQRVIVAMNATHNSSSSLPLQLGFCDMSRRPDYNDPCRQNDTSLTLEDFLQTPCTCGLVSWKFRSSHGVPVENGIPCTEYISILIHQLKEQLLQNFFLCHEWRTLSGTVKQVMPVTTSQERPYSAFVVHDPMSNVMGQRDLTHYLCLIWQKTSNVNCVI